MPKEKDARIERWLQDEVIPVYDAIEADPSLGLTPEQVADSLLALHRARSGKGSGSKGKLS
jgi:hypothetical protein